MFFCFAWATGWRQWVFQAVLFLFLSIMVGLINRWCARRWYKEVEVWSAERRALMARIEAAKSK
ncbi:MAG: hypothetical protein M5U26_07305 [Planctomycetota bacterium]|nr:hypothetical protein [Planctomycetota bacterium]